MGKASVAAAILSGTFALLACQAAQAELPLQGHIPEASVRIPLSFEQSWLDMPEVDATSFPMLRREAQNRAARAKSGPDAALDWLEYGRVLFNGGFFPEALSALERATMLGLPKTGDARSHAALLGLGLELAERDTCRCGGLDFRAEAGGSFFAHLIDLAKVEQPSTAQISALSAALAHQSPAVIAVTGPLLFEAAERSGDVALVGRLLEAITLGTPSPSSLILRLNGQYAELRGEDAEAFGYYVEALEHHDENSFRARLHIADMAIRNRDKAALGVVRDFLIEGLQEWHGGRTGLAMLTRLAAVSEALLDAPAALEAMARIRADYPDAAQAALAGDRAELILQSYSEDLAKGQVALQDYAQTIRKLRGGLADLKAWIPARKALAESFEAAGFSVAAAAEYAVMRGDIRVYQSPVSHALEADLLANHLRLLLQLDRKDDALNELMLRPDLVNGNLSIRALALQMMDAEALDSYLRDNSGAIFTPDELAQSARIRFAAGDLAAALQDWGNLLAAGGLLEAADAANYIYAKYKVESTAQLALDGVVSANDRAFFDAMVLAAKDPLIDFAQLDLNAARGLIDGAAKASAAAVAARQ